MKILLIALSLVIPQIAIARIGESMEQCNERYGEPLEVVDDLAGSIRVSYEKNPWNISVTFLDGVAESIGYFRYEVKDHENREAALQMLKLLALNITGDAKDWTMLRKKMVDISDKYSRIRRSVEHKGYYAESSFSDSNTCHAFIRSPKMQAYVTEREKERESLKGEDDY